MILRPEVETNTFPLTGENFGPVNCLVEIQIDTFLILRRSFHHDLHAFPQENLPDFPEASLKGLGCCSQWSDLSCL